VTATGEDGTQVPGFRTTAWCHSECLKQRPSAMPCAADFGSRFCSLPAEWATEDTCTRRNRPLTCGLCLVLRIQSLLISFSPLPPHFPLFRTSSAPATNGLQMSDEGEDDGEIYIYIRGQSVNPPVGGGGDGLLCAGSLLGSGAHSLGCVCGACHQWSLDGTFQPQMPMGSVMSVT
jgi:hypothetical protein